MADLEDGEIPMEDIDELFGTLKDNTFVACRLNPDQYDFIKSICNNIVNDPIFKYIIDNIRSINNILLVDGDNVVNNKSILISTLISDYITNDDHDDQTDAVDLTTCNKRIKRILNTGGMNTSNEGRNHCIECLDKLFNNINNPRNNIKKTISTFKRDNFFIIILSTDENIIPNYTLIRNDNIINIKIKKYNISELDDNILILLYNYYIEAGKNTYVLSGDHYSFYSENLNRIYLNTTLKKIDHCSYEYLVDYYTTNGILYSQDYLSTLYYTENDNENDKVKISFKNVGGETRDFYNFVEQLYLVLECRRNISEIPENDYIKYNDTRIPEDITRDQRRKIKDCSNKIRNRDQSIIYK